MTPTRPHPTTTPRHPAPAEPDGQVRTVLIAIVVCLVLVFAMIGGGVYMASGELTTALVTATFTAFWAGPGFGVVAGTALHGLASERARR